MNPILLKPNANGTSQVVVRGRVWKTLTARDYYEHFDELLPVVLEAYHDLARRFDMVITSDQVVPAAGGPVEFSVMTPSTTPGLATLVVGILANQPMTLSPFIGSLGLNPNNLIFLPIVTPQAGHASINVIAPDWRSAFLVNVNTQALYSYQTRVFMGPTATIRIR